MSVVVNTNKNVILLLLLLPKNWHVFLGVQNKQQRGDYWAKSKQDRSIVLAACQIICLLFLQKQQQKSHFMSIVIRHRARLQNDFSCKCCKQKCEISVPAYSERRFLDLTSPSLFNRFAHMYSNQSRRFEGCQGKQKEKKNRKEQEEKEIKQCIFKSRGLILKLNLTQNFKFFKWNRRLVVLKSAFNVFC